jgi:hypothetical protein
VAIAAAMALGVPLASAQSTGPDFTTLIVKYGKKSVQATLGSHCVPTPDGKGSCVQADYPLQTTGTVTVSRRGKVTLLLTAPATYIRWRAARPVPGDTKNPERIYATGEAFAVTKTKKRWRLTLPGDLRRSATLMGFDVLYSQAYSSFEVGINVR